MTTKELQEQIKKHQEHVEDMRQKLRDYKWNIAEYSRLKQKAKQLKQIIEKNSDHGGRSTVLTGGLAGIRGHHNDYKALNRLITRIDRLRKSMDEVLSLYDYVKQDREWVALDCLLDGMNVREISRHLMMAPRTVYRYIDVLIVRSIQNGKNNG